MQPRGETALVWRATTGPRRAMRRSCRRTAIIIYHPSSLSPPLSLLLFFLFIPVSFLFSSFAPIPFTTTLPPLPLSHSCSLFFSLSSSPFLSLSSFHSPSTPSPHRLCPFLTPFHVSFVPVFLFMLFPFVILSSPERKEMTGEDLQRRRFRIKWSLGLGQREQKIPLHDIIWSNFRREFRDSVLLHVLEVVVVFFV